MSDLRFVRELGAEFERLERAAAAESRRRRRPSWPGELPSRVVMAVAVAVPVAIAVMAIAFLGDSRDGGRHTATATASSPGLALSGGNCRTAAQTPPRLPESQTKPGPDRMVRAAGGQLSGIGWQLRVQPGRELLGAIEHGRLRVGGRQYGLCSQRAVPIPFGLVNASDHGIVYGYVTGGGGYRITVFAGSTPLTTTTTDAFFFIHALPRPACSYRALTVTATSTPVTGMPPAISRSLDETASRFTTTMRFGACHPHALVKVISEHGESGGRSPNAALAHVAAQVQLTAPSGSHSQAKGTIWELTHDGQLGINVLAFGLTPGRYGTWLLTAHERPAMLGAATIKHHELRVAYDLPHHASPAQVVIAAQPPGQAGTPGTIVLRATLP